MNQLQAANYFVWYGLRSSEYNQNKSRFYQLYTNYKIEYAKSRLLCNDLAIELALYKIPVFIQIQVSIIAG